MNRANSDRKKLIKKLDKVFSKFIRARDKHCVVCGTTQNLQCGHLFSRVAYSTRWDELNCHGQCASHNLLHEHDAYPFTDWFLRKFGKDQYDILHNRYAHHAIIKNWELILRITEFQEKLDKLTQKRSSGL